MAGPGGGRNTKPSAAGTVRSAKRPEPTVPVDPSVSTNTAHLGNYRRDKTYALLMQTRFDRIKAQMFGGLTKIAAATMSQGMGVQLDMTRQQVDMLVLRHMARGR